MSDVQPLVHTPAARRVAERRQRVLQAFQERAQPRLADAGAMAALLDELTRVLEGADAHLPEACRRRGCGSTALDALQNLGLLERVVLQELEAAGPLTADERVKLLDAFHVFRVAVTEELNDREQHLLTAQRSEERYLAAVRAAGFAIWDWDLRAETIHWSNNVEALLGRPLESLSQLGAWLEHVHPGDRQRVASGLEETVQQGRRGWSDTFRFLRRDGVYVGVLGRGWVLRDEAGEARRLVGGLVDVSEQQELARRLTEQEALTRTVAENAASCLFVLDPRGRATYLNPAAHRVTGHSLAELRDRSLHEVLHPHYDDGRPFPIEECPIHCEGASLRDYECTFMRRDGTIFVASCSVMPLARAAGGGAVLEFRDVTEVKRAEERLRRAIQTRDEFLSIASHELRTPLTALLLQIQSLTRGQLGAGIDAELVPRLVAAERSVDRMTRLVNDLLDVSRLRADRLRLQLDELDLTELVREVAERLQPEAKRAGCELQLALPDRVAGRWDRSRLEQVLSNLLTNAIKYGAGKPIAIALSAAADQVGLQVSDEGIGIAPEEQARIFDRFERAVSSRHFGGFGLGLWIAKQVVGAMGGSIRVESALGRGATFEVTLPRYVRGEGEGP